MGSLFTFALGAVSALVLVPILVNGRHRYHHGHGGPALKKGDGKSGSKRGK